MSNLTLRKLAIMVLKETKTPMTVEEIWDYAQQSKKIDTSKFQGKTPWRTIGAIIYTSIKDKSKQSEFKKIPGRPIRFGLINENYNKHSENIINKNDPNKSKQKDTMIERELHKYLAYFAAYRFDANTKTIDDKKSKKGTKGENEWLHPDMVGIYSPREDWEEDVLVLNGLTGSASVKIYSFEIKLELNFSNLRESFFQTVSNSYWANESYLAAKIIDDSRDFSDELKRLSSLFGIGIININVEEPQNTEILYNATYKPQLDWETINKLCEINTDYADFVNAIIVILTDKNKRLNKASITQYNKASITQYFDRIYTLEDFEKNMV